MDRISDIQMFQELSDVAKLSFLIDNPLPFGKGKESYVGKIQFISDSFIGLKTIGNPRITHLIVRPELIVSIWAYK